FDVVEVFAEGFAFLPANLVKVFKDALQTAEFFEPAGCESEAHARDPGQVIGAFAHQCGQFGVLFQGYAIAFDDRVGVEGWQIGDSAHRVEHGDVVVDELEGVTVSRDDAGAPAGSDRGGGHGGDDIICFVPVEFYGWDVEGLHNLFDQVDLTIKFFGGFISAGLIFGVLFGAERGGFQVEGHGNLGGFLFPDHGQQHGEKSVDRVGVLAGCGLEVFGR